MTATIILYNWTRTDLSLQAKRKSITGLRKKKPKQATALKPIRETIASDTSQSTRVSEKDKDSTPEPDELQGGRRLLSTQHNRRKQPPTRVHKPSTRFGYTVMPPYMLIFG